MSATANRESRTRTQYTIDDKVCPPSRRHVLETVVQKACRFINIYLDRRPIATHTREAFDDLLNRIVADCLDHKIINDREVNETMASLNIQNLIMECYPDGIILDSGCGTGRSTKFLAEQHANHLVLGIDRSIVRLTKTKVNQVPAHIDSYGADEDRPEYEFQLTLRDRAYTHKIGRNAYLIRAELVDFWRCCINHDRGVWASSGIITHHYLLYPNPYPTPQRITQRWYAHPSFPLILQLNATQIILRSNWEVYLTEFAKAVEVACDYYEACGSKPRQNCAASYLQSARKGPYERRDKSVALTNFEAKYDNVEEPTFELILYQDNQATDV